MTYRTASGVEERVWNSLPDRNPLSAITEATTGERAEAVLDKSDYRPDYTPQLGERVFVRMDETLMRHKAAEIVDNEAERMSEAHREAMHRECASREEAIDRLVMVLEVRDAIHVTPVTHAFLEGLASARQHVAASGNQQLLDATPDEEDRFMKLVALFALARRARSEKDEALESLDSSFCYWDRQGTQISRETFFRLREDRNYCLVAETIITQDLLIATVWMGFDEHDAERPEVFQSAEVRLSGDSEPVVRRSYVTEAAAIRGHAELVRLARNAV